MLRARTTAAATCAVSRSLGRRFVVVAVGAAAPLLLGGRRTFIARPPGWTPRQQAFADTIGNILKEPEWRSAIPTAFGTTTGYRNPPAEDLPHPKSPSWGNCKSNDGVPEPYFGREPWRNPRSVTHIDDATEALIQRLRRERDEALDRVGVVEGQLATGMRSMTRELKRAVDAIRAAKIPYTVDAPPSTEDDGKTTLPTWTPPPPSPRAAPSSPPQPDASPAPSSSRAVTTNHAAAKATSQGSGTPVRSYENFILEGYRTSDGFFVHGRPVFRDTNKVLWARCCQRFRSVVAFGVSLYVSYVYNVEAEANLVTAHWNANKVVLHAPRDVLQN